MVTLKYQSPMVSCLAVTLMAFVLLREEQMVTAERMEIRCVDDYVDYCSTKKDGFQFNDGCKICTCNKKDAQCLTGPCKFFVSTIDEAMDYCDKVFLKNDHDYTDFLKRTIPPQVTTIGLTSSHDQNTYTSQASANKLETAVVVPKNPIPTVEITAQDTKLSKRIDSKNKLEAAVVVPKNPIPTVEITAQDTKLSKRIDSKNKFEAAVVVPKNPIPTVEITVQDTKLSKSIDSDHGKSTNSTGNSTGPISNSQKSPLSQKEENLAQDKLSKNALLLKHGSNLQKKKITIKRKHKLKYPKQEHHRRHRKRAYEREHHEHKRRVHTEREHRLRKEFRHKSHQHRMRPQMLAKPKKPIVKHIEPPLIIAKPHHSVHLNIRKHLKNIHQNLHRKYEKLRHKKKISKHLQKQHELNAKRHFLKQAHENFHKKGGPKKKFIRRKEKFDHRKHNNLKDKHIYLKPHRLPPFRPHHPQFHHLRHLHKYKKVSTVPTPAPTEKKLYKRETHNSASLIALPGHMHSVLLSIALIIMCWLL